MWAAASPSQRISRDDLQPGDIIMINYNGNLSTNVSTFYGEHTGIVISRNSDGTYTTIEGNAHYESTDPRYPKDNGGAVARRIRAKNIIIGGVRLFADKSDTTSVDWSKELYSSYTYYSNQSALDVYKGSSVSESEAATVERTVTNHEIKSIDISPNSLRTKSASLLTFPSYVESPFVMVTVGEHTFGSYTIEGNFNKPGSKVNVQYPNYITSLTAIKINGSVNQYTINIVYQIEAGNDPNLLDKIFSKVGYGKIKISYGDWMSPAFIYKEEEAMITNLTTEVDFANSRITYVLKCTSTSLMAISGNYYFPPVEDKPSNIIKDILYDKNTTYKLLDVFPGMKNSTKVYSSGLIRTDDRIVKIEAKVGMDALSYINYLVTCMTSGTTDNTTGLRDSNYYLTICDDVNNEFGGSYFKITKVEANTTLKSLNNTNIYEVDIGYPGDTLVTGFKINNDNSWALLYDYSNQVVDNNYTYEIDNSGNIQQVYSPNIMLSSKYGRVTETQRNWWTQMTQFPITATLEIKGLLRPALLMTYVRINALFYGQRHISSGIYIITKQEDRVNSRGYRTILSLTRIAGDLDFIAPSNTVTSTSNSTGSGYGKQSGVPGGGFGGGGGGGRR